MGSSVLAELVSLIRDHPYISCFLLVFLTPPFWPILMYFSPLLISTALFLVALITMGPQFEEEPQEQEFQAPIEHEPAPHHRREAATEESYYRKPSKGVGDYLASWKDSGLMWVEHRLQNKNWRGASLTDENVSILQEAFAHRVEETPRVMVKFMTRRIPAEDEEDHTRDLHTRSMTTRRIPGEEDEDHTREIHTRDFHTRSLPARDLHARELSHSGSWNSFRGGSSSPPARDIPHDFFAPHRSLSRRLDSDASLFENVEPPPIEHDMPPQITGPASVTAPLLKYIEDHGSDSDEYDHHHHDEHLEFGERSLDAESISQDELSLANGTYGQPPPFTVREEDLPSSGSSDEGRQFFGELHHGTSEIESLPPSEDIVHTRDLDLHEVASAPPHVEIVHEEAPREEVPPPPPPPPAAPPAAPEEPPHSDELHDIPELEDEDVAPPEVHTREIEAPVEHETSEAPRATSWKQEALEALAADAALEHETSEAHSAALEHEVLEAPPAAHEHEVLEAPPAAHEHEVPEAPVAHEHEILEAPAAAAPEHEAPAAPEHEVLEVPAAAAPEHEHSEAPPEHEPSEAPAAVDEHHAHEEPEVPAHHEEEVHKDMEVPHVAFAPEPEVAPVHVREHSMERSMSMPVAATLATAVSMEPSEEAHEEALAPVPPEPRTLSNAISLPSGSNAIHPLIIPPKTSSEQQQGPLSPDTDLGYATTPDHDRTRALAGRFFAPERHNSITSMSGDESEVAIPSKILSPAERLSKLEALSNSMPVSGEVSGRRDVSILRATTDEQITHVSDKLRAYKDTPSKRFQPDAPQLRITPPSTRVVFTGPPSKSALLSQTIGRPSIRQVSKFAEKYVSSSSDSSSEEIELDDSDGAGDGSESDSDYESMPVKPSYKPPQGKKTEPVKKK